MKSTINNLNGNQPKLLSKRADKKRVNIPWNHRLFFQLGLIVSLLITFFVMESSLGYVATVKKNQSSRTLDEPYVISEFIIEKPKVVEVVKLKNIKKPAPIITRPISDIVEVSSQTNVIETPTTSVDKPIISDPPNTATTKPPVNMGKPLNLRDVEFVPIYPGCESLGSNKEKIACMSSKIGEFIQKKFRTDKFNYLEADMTHRVYVSFKIDKTGGISEVKARSTRTELEAEGIRVIEKLPEMTPGRQGDTKVDVMYMLPISFKVD